MKKLTIILFLSLFTYVAKAQLLKPAKWSYEVSKKEVKVGETIELIFYVDIQDGWYIYSSDFKMEDGPLPAEFNFQPHESYELVGGIKAIGSKKKYDEIFEGEYTYFAKKAEFRQTVKILKPYPQITVEYSYQSCSDKSGQCIPFEDEHTFAGIKVTASAAPVQKKDTQEKKTEQVESVKQPVKKTANKPATFYSKRISELEQQKAALIIYDEKGEDESLRYLKNFVNTYGK